MHFDRCITKRGGKTIATLWDMADFHNPSVAPRSPYRVVLSRRRSLVLCKSADIADDGTLEMGPVPIPLIAKLDDQLGQPLNIGHTSNNPAINSYFQPAHLIRLFARIRE
jgi:hypothetical protein